MAKKRISDFDLKKYVGQGMGVSEIAKVLQASKGTISERCKKLELKPMVRRSIGVGKGVALSPGGDGKLGQLRKINKLTIEILEKAMNALKDEEKAGEKIVNPLGLIFKTMGQIESQIKTEFSILEGLHSMEVEQSFREFSEEVLGVIEEVDPDVKKEIVRRLRERKATHAAIGRA